MRLVERRIIASSSVRRRYHGAVYSELASFRSIVVSIGERVCKFRNRAHVASGKIRDISVAASSGQEIPHGDKAVGPRQQGDTVSLVVLLDCGTAPA